MARDYYEVLGVPRNASKSDIKKAFRSLARQYHPDVSNEPDAEAKFKEINEAYEVLSDDNKRAQFDRFGMAGLGNSGGFSPEDLYRDIFDEFLSGFGMRSNRRQGPRPGKDRRVDINITFEESVFGVEKELEYDRYEVCDHCNGSGAEPGTSPVRCPVCNGTGQERRYQQTFMGSFTSMTTCSRCQGRGEIVETPCKVCNGNRRIRKQVKISTPISPGAREGTQFRITGQGDAGEPGAPNGNLYVVVHPQAHAFFKRLENDIILDITINVAQAALGDKVIVPTVDGDYDLTIPAGTQTGKVFRIRGRGVPRLMQDGSNSGRGDQLVYVQVEIPAKLSDKQRQLFEELAETLGHDIQPQNSNGRGFFDRVMDFFAGDQN